MDVMQLRRNLLMQKIEPIDLFDGSNVVTGKRIQKSDVGTDVNYANSTASKVYVRALRIEKNKYYKLVYMITNPVSTNERQCEYVNDNDKVLNSKLIIRMDRGLNELTIYPNYDGYLWMTVDNNVDWIHIYEV